MKRNFFGLELSMVFNCLLSYKQSTRVSDCFDKIYYPWTVSDINHFLQECGLMSTHIFGLWLNHTSKVSYLHITNTRKFLFAKLKYGF
jgi:hypothetical protein